MKNDQFFRTPHLNTSDLRFFISSSVDEAVDFAVFTAFAADLEVDFVGREDSFAFLLGFVTGGVESIRTDMSESLSSPCTTFRFFELPLSPSTDFRFFCDSDSATPFERDTAFAFTGDLGDF
jgi:hypothetical protein